MRRLAIALESGSEPAAHWTVTQGVQVGSPLATRVSSGPSDPGGTRVLVAMMATP